MNIGDLKWVELLDKVNILSIEFKEEFMPLKDSIMEKYKLRALAVLSDYDAIFKGLTID